MAETRFGPSDPSWSPLVLVLQEMTLANEENLPMFNRCGVMALVAAYLNFLSQMIANPPFCLHVSKVREVPRFLGSCWTHRLTLRSPQVIELRTLMAPYLLPEHVFRDKCP